jgi:23S rRNA (uracil1939-C5)-methyltransferase
MLAAATTLGYRRRVRLHVKGRQVGFMGRRTHRLVDVERCLTLAPELDRALGRIRSAFSRDGPIAGLEQVGLVCGSHGAAASYHFVKRPSASSESRLEALGFAAVVLEGDREISRIGDPVVQIGKVELFSGSGNLTFVAAQRASSVTAVEQSAPAIELARRSAREAGVTNVRFVVGDAIDVAASLAKEGAFDLVLLDPPRTGAAGIGKAAAALGARRVIYVSCEPATLARDARDLVGRGYQVLSVQPIDMFPQTYHVEAVVTFVDA